MSETTQAGPVLGDEAFTPGHCAFMELHDSHTVLSNGERCDGTPLNVAALVAAAEQRGSGEGALRAARMIEGNPGPDPGPSSPEWWKGYFAARRDSARIARDPS